MVKGKAQDNPTYRPAAAGDAFLAKQKENRARAKAEKAEDAKPKPDGGPGHNSKTQLTDDQEQALFFQHKRKIGALKDKLAEVNSDLRNAYKQAKAENFAKKDFDWAFKLDDADAEGELMEEAKRREQIARWMGHPVGTQAELNFGGVDRTPIDDKARAAGKRHAMAGGAAVVPAEFSGPAVQAWLDGWHEGDKAFRSVKDKTRAEIEEGEQFFNDQLPTVTGATPPPPAPAATAPN